MIETPYSSVSKPEVKINTDSMKFTFWVDIHIMNPFDNSIDAIVMKAKFTPSFQVSVRKDLKMYLECDEMEMEFTELNAFFKTNVNKDSLSIRIGYLKPFVVAYINSMLMDGIQIPIPDNYKTMIKNPKVVLNKSYIKIEFEPDFTNANKTLSLMVQAPKFDASKDETKVAFDNMARELVKVFFQDDDRDLKFLSA